MRALRYSVSEAVASLWRGRRSSSLSIATIAAAILVLGGLLLVSWNVERVVARWADAAEMSVYLRDGASTEALSAVEQMLGESALVASYERVSKAEAVARFRRDFEGLSRLAPEGASPFPASFEVRMASGATTGEIAGLARVLEGAGGVDEVRFDQAWIARLLLAVAVARSVGVALVLVLVAAAALTVANVVQLACFARRDEIEIMHLVGAPLRFVRGPFVAEGVLQGGIGALMALLVLGAGFATVKSMYGETAAGLLGLDDVQFLPLGRVLLMVLGGMAVGCLGGLVAARNTGERSG